METTSIDFRNMDELVFEKRNKLYGAYLLRSCYNNHVFLAFLAAHVLAVVFILSFRFGGTGSGDIVEGLSLPSGVIELENLPVLPNPKQAKSVVHTVERKDVMPTRVVSHPVEPPVDSDQDQQYVQQVDGLQGGDVTEGENNLVLGNGDDDETIAPPPTSEPIVLGIQATYKGGMEAMVKFLRKKIRQPHRSVKGIVFVQFVVNSKGEVVDVQVLKGIDRDYDREAVRVVSLMDGWEAASQGGKPVSVRMVLPINFTLPE